MNSLVACILALTLAVAAVSAGMDCGVAGTCPNVLNKIGTAMTGTDENKAYCCKTDALSIPYCCDLGDYGKYQWDRVFSSADSTKVVTATTIGAILLARLL